MFHRRLLLLTGLMVAGAVLPVARTIDLTLRRVDELRDRAEAQLVEQRFIPTTRGKIIDRRGTVLAADQPSYDVEVDYALISGQWAFTQAARAARSVHRARWAELSPVLRERLVQEYLPAQQQRLADAWTELARLTGVSPAELERRRSAIVERVSGQAAAVWEGKRRELAEALARGRALSADDDAQSAVPLAQVQRPIKEQQSPHVIIRGLEEDRAFSFPTTDTTSSPLLPGMRLVDSKRRWYPGDELLVTVDRAHFPGPIRADQPVEVLVSGSSAPLVGWMRDRLFKEDIERRPMRTRDPQGRETLDLGGYAEGDSLGAAGLELSGEQTLRGLRGTVTERLDTGEAQRSAPVHGRDVALTIDARLQARVAALMQPQTGLTVVQRWQNNKAQPEGTQLHAAAAVLEISSGQVLALVSTPGFTREQAQSDPQSLMDEAAGQPLLNRAIARAYAPGSIVKPLVYCAAVTSGVWRAGQGVACNGHFDPARADRLRCWIFKQGSTTHAAQFGRELFADEAIMVSCNIYFYTLGQRLGPNGLTNLFTSLGVDAPSDQAPASADPNAPTQRWRLGVGPQFDGSVGRMRATQPDQPAPSITPAEAVLMGIGQGPLAWTPLHAADAYATLARSGVRLIPTVRQDQPAQRIDLRWDPAAVTIAMRGLAMAVNDPRGTGHHLSYNTGDGIPVKEPTFNIPGVNIWGKSGTADSGKTSEDNPEASLDHSWFVVLVGPAGSPAPTHAVALIVEYGGSGGRVAGPLVNQLLWALRAEGYL
jgi:cell division protein FtsI/penicillin-binding protein 2